MDLSLCRVLGRWAALGAVCVAFGCQEEPEEEEADSRYRGVTTLGDAVQYEIYRESSALEASSGDDQGSASTVFSEHEDIELDSVLTDVDDPTRVAIEIEDVALITNFSTGSGNPTLGVALSAEEANGYGAHTTARLVEGDYLWLSMEECGAGDLAWGFLTVQDGVYASRRMGPPVTLQDVDVFEGTVSEELADETGTWSISDSSPGAMDLMGGGVEQQAWLLPGRALLIQRGSGFWFAISNPASHLSVLNASGIYKFMDVRCRSGELHSWGVGNFSIFDREVNFLRYGSDGSVEELSGDLDWHENVGSGFGLLAGPQEGADQEFGRIYFSVVEDLALLFQHGSYPSVGLAMRVGIAGL